MKAKILAISIMLIANISSVSFASANNDPVQLATTIASAAWTVGTATAAIGGIFSLSMLAKWGFEEVCDKESSCPMIRLRKLEQQSSQYLTKRDVEDVTHAIPELYTHTRILSKRTHLLNHRLRTLEKQAAKKQHMLLMDSPKKTNAAAKARKEFVLELDRSLS